MAQVQCPQCKSKIALTPRVAGRLVKCQCGSKLRMPGTKSDAAPAPSMAASRPAVANSSLAKIRFQCPQCSKTLQAPGEMSGKVSRCACGAKMRVPSPSSTPALQTSSDPFVSVPGGDPFANDPLSSPPLGADPLSSPPLGGDPLADDPLGLMPLESENPYASSGLMSAASPGVDPLTGLPEGQAALPNVSSRRRKQSGQSRRQKLESRREKLDRKRAEDEESDSAMYQIGSGIFMMVGAVVWLVAGLFAGYIFFYPPVLFIFGLVAVISGICRL